MQSNGAAFGDIDNDGDPDLYVTVMGNAGDAPNNRNYLFVNNGSGVFLEDAPARGAAITSAAERRGFSATFGDYDRDGFLDLHTTEWFPGSVSHFRLLRNRGSDAPGFFEDTTTAAGVEIGEVDGFASS